MSPKEDRLLLMSGTPATVAGNNKLAVVLNWVEELKRRVPVN